ncbi:MAG: DNA/RNA nuclease SfsA [Myxococcales bacterium]|nr:DNA/RNA nuclease SfsA [Myxococcales bacterium]
MLFDPPLKPVTLMGRRKRFFADIVFPDGRTDVAHCPNSGSMKQCLERGQVAYVSRSPNTKRSLPLTLELLRIDGATVLVNTQRPNALVAEAITMRRVPELDGYPILRREVHFGEEGSRVDLVLERGVDSKLERVFVEVKNATMGVGGGLTRFPDAVTERGQKHLRELALMRSRGHRAVLFFCAGRDDTTVVSPADEIDPAYGRLLREVVRDGVEVLAYRCDLSPKACAISRRVEVSL